MNKQAAWLLQELPELLAKGVLDEATAARLREYYARALANPGYGWGMILLAIGGAALVGMGIILIFAHNWENWTPEVRVALSLAPLLAGQAAVWHALRNGSRLWAEGAGLFTALAIGASIALIAQTYQFGGDLPGFILTWTLLAIPLIYLLDASAVAAACWVGVLGWAAVSGDNHWWDDAGSLLAAMRLPAFLLLACLPLPHLLKHLRINRASARVAWMLRVLLVVLVLGFPMSMNWTDFDFLFFIYSGMAAVAALTGRHYFSGVQGLWGNPLFSAGMLGTCVMALIASTSELWREVHLPQSSALLLPIALGLLSAWIALQCARQGDILLPALLAALVPGVLLMAGVASSQPVLAMGLGHLYVVALAAALIRTGLGEARLGLANQGVALIAALVLLRFFDSDLSYVVRGVGFIVVGAGFFAANVWLRRRLQEAGA